MGMNVEDAMDLLEITNLTHMGLVGLAVILAGMIKIPKLEINFWNWIGRTIGRSINKEAMQQVTDFSANMTKQINDISKKVDEIEKIDELERVRRARQRILRFNDEILCGRKHSKEHFDEILDDITKYEHYCNTHKDYENDKAILAIESIREVYKQCMKTHDFLMPIKKTED